MLAAFGSLAGSLLEIAIRYVSHTWIPWPRAALYFNAQAVWLGPLANGVLLLIPVALTLALAGRIGRERAMRFIAWMSFSLAAFAPLLLTPRIHNAALALLAAGVGATATRWLFESPTRFRLIRRATFGLLAVSALLTVGWNAILMFSERRAVAELPPPTGTRSVLLVIFDTVRGSNLSSYGHRRPTSPRLDSLAAGGARFAAAVSTAPWTLPSHVSMLTGRWDHEQATSWTEGRSGRYPIIPQRLAPRGYASAGFSANLEYVSRLFNMQLGFGAFRDHIVSPWSMLDASVVTRFARGHLPERLIWRIPGRKTAAHVNDEFLSWQAGLDGRPFFAMLNYYDAHAPYAPPVPFDMMFLAEEPPSRNAWPGPPFPPEVLTGLEAAYDGGIAYADYEFGRLLDELDRRGVLDSTIVIATSDHGEEFGDHDMIGHGHGLNYPAVHVPLIVRAPGMPGGTVVEAPVSLIDLAATIMDLAVGRRDSVIPGFSLLPLWRGDSAAPRSPAMSEVDWADHVPANVPLAKGDMASIVSGRLHLIRRGDGVLSLYDRVADPREQQDLSADPRYASQRDQMVRELDAARRLGIVRPRSHR